MTNDEIVLCVKDTLEQNIIAGKFTGTVRFEVHCNSGTFRRVVIIQEPEKKEFTEYKPKTKIDQ